MRPYNFPISFLNLHSSIRGLLPMDGVARSRASLMKSLIPLSICLLSLCASTVAQGPDSIKSIGPVIQWTRTPAGVSLICGDRSNVHVSILAPDLVRVTAAFGTLVPQHDHSWAIEKTSWEPPRWELKEEANRFLISTDDLEITIERSPFLIEFRDPKSHRLINADARPMTYDTKEGTITAARRLGLDEHFYGL